jgi:phosphatidylserine decarboxylase
MPATVSSLGERLFQQRVGPAAAAALIAEFARAPGPKHALVIGTAPAVLAEAIDALAPQDRLTIVAPTGGPDIRSHIGDIRAGAEEHVTVVDSVAHADPVDAIILADLVAGTADEVRGELEGLAKHLNPGGVVCLAVPAAAFLAGAAGQECDRHAALYGVGCDLVLRNVPPVRVHRLRFTPATAALAEQLAPLHRTSSVRLTPSMHIDSNGIAAAAICLGAAALVKRARPERRLWLLPALAALPVAAFFRDPNREVPGDAQAIVGASDGKVLSVERVRDERLGTEEFLRVAVFLSVLDVHINRSPVAGRVVDHFVVDGGYAAAMKPEAEHNVAAYTVLETVRGTVAVVQRTGLIARRIVQRAPVGALLAKGERFGLIRFGSRTDVYLPVDAAVAMVAPGDTVRGGETIVACWT